MIAASAGVLAAGAIAFLAYRTRALTLDGALAAWATGAIVFATGGWAAAAVLLAFFVSSSAWSLVGTSRKRSPDTGKHGPRDARQVLANGGVAALCALLAVRGVPGAWAAFAGAFAAAAADTWATEIGSLSPETPRSIVGWHRVVPGMSGGVTLLGTLASAGGAACVASIAALTGLAPFVPVAIGGVTGSLADSLIGATLQTLRWCPRCDRTCEIDPHACGTPTTIRRGVRWMDNDAVNAAATLSGALVAAMIAGARP